MERVERLGGIIMTTLIELISNYPLLAYLLFGAIVIGWLWFKAETSPFDYELWPEDEHEDADHGQS